MGIGEGIKMGMGLKEEYNFAAVLDFDFEFSFVSGTVVDVEALLLA
jgi:hypothetical protein